MEAIHHASHPHELELKSYNQPYTCDGCRELGIGARFRCEECDFDLHEECVQSNQTTSHDFFQNCTFKFLSKPPNNRQRYCDGCGNLVKGFVYHCKEKGWDLHPICFNLPRTLKADDVTFKLYEKMLPIRCIWCKRRRLEGSLSGIRGWSYVSTCKNYIIHVYCAMQMMFQVWEKGPNLGNNMEQSILALFKIPIRGVLVRKRRNIAMMFVIANVVLELVSAVLDQVSSLNKLQCALFGMLISFAATITCLLELIYEGRKEKLIWRWRGTLPLPWCYYQDGGRKPFGTFTDIVGLVCALCQSVVATVKYCYLQRHADDPIKISIFPTLKNRDSERPYCENETLV